MSTELDLEFIKQPVLSSANWLSISILLLSLLMAALVWQGYQSQQLTLAASTLQLKQFNQQTPTKSQASTTNIAQITFEETKQLTEAVDLLTTPWSALLMAIEEADMQDIALLSLEPNSKKQLVVLTGEAKNLSVVLQYIKQLQQTPMLAQVYLQKHSIDESDASKPVRFSLLAKWDLADQSVMADN